MKLTAEWRFVALAFAIGAVFSVPGAHAHIFGNRAIIGAYGDEENGREAGAAFLTTIP